MYFNLSEMMKAEQQGNLKDYLDAEFQRIKEDDAQRLATADERYQTYLSMVREDGNSELIKYVTSHAEEIKEIFARPFMESVRLASQRVQRPRSIAEDVAYMKRERDDLTPNDEL